MPVVVAVILIGNWIAVAGYAVLAVTAVLALVVNG